MQVVPLFMHAEGEEAESRSTPAAAVHLLENACQVTFKENCVITESRTMTMVLFSSTYLCSLDLWQIWERRNWKRLRWLVVKPSGAPNQQVEMVLAWGSGATAATCVHFSPGLLGQSQ